MNTKKCFIHGIAALLFGTASVSMAGSSIRDGLLRDEKLSLHMAFDQNFDASGISPNSGSVLHGETQFVPGRVNDALSFKNQEAGQVKVPLSADQLNLKEGTIMFWFKPAWSGEDASGKYTLLWITMKNPDKYLAFHRSFSEEDPRLLYVNLANENGLSAKMVPGFEQDRWVHVAFTWNADENYSVLYFNGEPAARSTWKDHSNEEQFTPSHLLLGKYYAKDDPINASYDELFILLRSLPQDDIWQYIQECETSR